MKGKFLLTYTVKENNAKALCKIETLLKEFDFKQEKDQSTYMGGNSVTQTELQNRLCEIRQHLNPEEEHITVYYAQDNLICRG